MTKMSFKTIGTMAAIAAIAGVCAMAPAAFAQTFQLKSSDISADQPIAQQFAFKGFGCTGGNVSPALEWKNALGGTTSLIVMVHDPDAVTGGAGFWHWVVINLPASLNGLRQGVGSADGPSLPEGARQIATDFGTAGWGGPCLPAGDKPALISIHGVCLKG